jgi:hypothetical protein
VPTDKLSSFCASPVGFTAADATFVADVAAYLKVVDVGTAVTVNVPLKGAPTPSTTTTSLTTRPCAVAEVSVAVLEVSALVVIESGVMLW